MRVLLLMAGLAVAVTTVTAHAPAAATRRAPTCSGEDGDRERVLPPTCQVRTAARASRPARSAPSAHALLPGTVTLPATAALHDDVLRERARPYALSGPRLTSAPRAPPVG